jgi:predicted permease
MTAGEMWRRLLYFLNRRRVERELEAEMAAHRALMGEPRRFGNLLKLREQSGDVWGWGTVDAAVQDVRYALRVLRRVPSFAFTAVVILSAGIGLNLTFFHLLNVTMLQALPVKDPATLVRLERRGRTFTSSHVPFPAAQFIREHNDVLTAVLTHRQSDVVWDGERSRKLGISFVSPNWFAELGYSAAVGRAFSEAVDARADAAPVVVVSDQFWRQRTGSDPRIVGRTLTLNDRPATVIGVMPPRFPDLDLDNPEMWLLIDQVEYFEPGNRFNQSWDNNTEMYGRLREGLSPSAAADALRVPLAALAQMRPQSFQPDEWLEAANAEGRFLNARDRQKLFGAAALFGGLTLLVLLVASANLANLVLSHTIGRIRELSVRMALGASRWRILRHIVTECSVLAAAGALGGIAIAYASARVFAAMTELPPYLDFTPDTRLFVAAFSVAFLAMLAFGLVPAWMVSRRDLIRAIRDGGHQASGSLSRARFRLTLVGVQVLGCCALLVVAGAMGRGLQRLFATDPGFAFARVAVLEASLERHGIRADAARAFWSRVVDTVSSRPDVEQVAFASPAPLGGAVMTAGYGFDSGPVSISVVHMERAAFSLLEIPLVVGRPFEDAEAKAVVISQRIALRMYGTVDVLGRGYPKSKPTRTIVGVARDAMILDLRASNSAEEYNPLEPYHYIGAVLLVKTRTTPQGVLLPLQAAARSADGRVQPTTRVLSADYEERLRQPALASTIAGLVAVLVLTLACLGIFGVVAYTVKLRTREIGIRRALGAGAPSILATVLRQLVWPIGIGIVVGMAAGLVASRLLGGKPFYLAVTDATAPSAALLVFVLAGLAAAIFPASRAMYDDPIRALRHE